MPLHSNLLPRTSERILPPRPGGKKLGMRGDSPETEQSNEYPEHQSELAQREKEMLNMFSSPKHIAVDLGTANTLVYVYRQGIVMNEPSVVAVDTEQKKVVAIGHEANKMVGMTHNRIETVRPLRDGVIVDFTLTEAFLRTLLKKVLKWHMLNHPKMVIAVPFGITEVEKKAVRDLAIQAGANEVTLMLEPVAAALGAGLPVLKPSGNLIVDIGGGTTEVAVISLAGIVYSHSIRIAGDEMDEAIIKHIKKKYNLLIGMRTAEKIKRVLGSASPMNSEKVVQIKGRSYRGGPIKIKIRSEDIREALSATIFAIINAIRATLEQTPPEIAADICERGISLTGGSALLRSLDHKIKEEFGLPVTLAGNPLTNVALGAGKVLTDASLLKKVAIA